MLSQQSLFNLVAHVTDPRVNTFYRHLYGLSPDSSGIELRSMEDWASLPTLTKDHLAARTLDDRSFVPLSRLDHVRASSGTSGKTPLFSPRTHVTGLEYRLGLHDFAGAFLAFTVPLMPHWHERFMREHGFRGPVLCHDPAHPLASARLAKAAGAEALSVFVYHIRDIGEALKAVNHTSQIRLIEITGEICTTAQLAYIRSTFPNATVVQSYNSSEVEDAHIGIPCRPLTPEDPIARYHPKDTHYLEIVDPDTGAILPLKAGTEGDLLVTAYPGDTASFPLVRFRIGDTIRILESACAAHGTWTFTVLGRTDMDFVKIPGGVVRADEIARVLRLMDGDVTDRFQLICDDTMTPSGPRPSFTLRVERVDRTVDLTKLASAIAKQLLVAPSVSYEDGVREGRYEPLTCEELTIGSTQKVRRITRR